MCKPATQQLGTTDERKMALPAFPYTSVGCKGTNKLTN